MEDLLSTKAWPVAVLMKMHEPVVCGFAGKFTAPIPEVQTHLHVVGYLPEELVENSAESFDEVHMRLATQGLKLNVYVSSALKDTSSMGVAVFYGVEVSDMDAAQTIPTFRQSTMWAGYQRMPEVPT